jgi:hypothetical protein
MMTGSTWSIRLRTIIILEIVKMGQEVSTLFYNGYIVERNTLNRHSEEFKKL